MTAYINLATLEYPRHEGDIALDPEGEYAPVAWVDPPEYDGSAQVVYEGAPEFVDGSWYMTWLLREITPEDIFVPGNLLGDITAAGSAPDVVG